MDKIPTWEITHLIETICDIMRKYKISRFQQENGEFEVMIKKESEGNDYKDKKKTK